jgi:hypothetical protein
MDFSTILFGSTDEILKHIKEYKEKEEEEEEIEDIDELDYFNTVDERNDFYAVEYLNDYTEKKIYDKDTVPENKFTITILSTFDHQGTLNFSLENIKNQYQIIAFQLDKYIKKVGGSDYTILHQVLPRRGKQKSDELSERYQNFETHKVDFIIACDNRALVYRPLSFTEKLKSCAKQGVFTFSANTGVIGPEDVLFYMVPSGKRNKRHCKYLGWTCDSTLCKPMQLKNKFRILIDHSYYGRYQNMIKSDMTDSITKQVCEFAKTKRINGKRFIVKRFINGGIEQVDVKNPSIMEKYVQNNGLSYLEACREYSRTDVFIVTHKECMGLSVLENAMAGALIVAPKGYIKEELLSKVHHVEFEETIDWDIVMQSIDVKKSRKMALQFDIQKFVQKILVVMNRTEILKENGYLFSNKY